MEPNLGQLTNQIDRDAIHIAVLPLVADNSFSAGMQVLLTNDGKASNETGTVIGIVDPFLTTEVKRGDRFWVFLYPNTVTGMRHHWSHPAVDKIPTDKNYVTRVTLSDEVKKEIGIICDEINRECSYAEFDVESILFLAENYWSNSDFYCGSYEEYDFNRHYQKLRPLLNLLGFNLPEENDEGHTFFRSEFS